MSFTPSADSDPPPAQSFSERLRYLEVRGHDRDLTLQELLEVNGPKGHDFLTFFLVLPFLQPVPLPGLSIPLGSAVAIFGFCKLIARPPWLPRQLSKIHLPHRAVSRLFGVSAQVLSWLERWTNSERESKLFARVVGPRVIGAAVLVLGFLLALPLPIPTSNFVPSLALFFWALASLEESFVLLLFAAFFTLVNAIFFGALVWFSLHGVTWLKNSAGP